MSLFIIINANRRFKQKNNGKDGKDGEKKFKAVSEESLNKNFNRNLMDKEEIEEKIRSILSRYKDPYNISKETLEKISELENLISDYSFYYKHKDPKIYYDLVRHTYDHLIVIKRAKMNLEKIEKKNFYYLVLSTKKVVENLAYNKLLLSKIKKSLELHKRDARNKGVPLLLYLYTWYIISSNISNFQSPLFATIVKASIPLTLFAAYKSFLYVKRASKIKNIKQLLLSNTFEKLEELKKIENELANEKED